MRRMLILYCMYLLFHVAISCPSGLVYQQCGPVCPLTCDTDEDTDCSSGCVEGCFCPSGKVLYKGICVNKADCEGNIIEMHFYISICMYACT